MKITKGHKTAQNRTYRESPCHWYVLTQPGERGQAGKASAPNFLDMQQELGAVQLASNSQSTHRGVISRCNRVVQRVALLRTCALCNRETGRTKWRQTASLHTGESSSVAIYLNAIFTLRPLQKDVES